VGWEEAEEAEEAEDFNAHLTTIALN